MPLPDDLPARPRLPARLRRHHRGRRRGEHRPRCRPGASVAVIGAGGVGLNAIQGAALAGAVRIVAVDVQPGQARRRPRLRRHRWRRSPAPTPPRAVRAPHRRPRRRLRLRHRRRTRRRSAPPPAPRRRRRRRRRRHAAASGSSVGYDPTTLAAMNQRILGSRMGQTVLARDIPWLIEHWRAGRLKLAELVAGRYPLDDINEAIAATRAGAARPQRHRARRRAVKLARPRDPRRRQPAPGLRRPLLHLRQAHHRRRHRRLGRGLRRDRRPRRRCAR